MLIQHFEQNNVCVYMNMLFSVKQFWLKGFLTYCNMCAGWLVLQTMTRWSLLPSAKTVNNSDERTREFMVTSSNGNVFLATGPLCGELTGPGEFHTQRPVARKFHVFFDLRLDKRLSRQSRRRWFEMQLSILWRHCNVYDYVHNGPHCCIT